MGAACSQGFHRRHLHILHLLGPIPLLPFVPRVGSPARLLHMLCSVAKVKQSRSCSWGAKAIDCLGIRNRVLRTLQSQAPWRFCHRLHLRSCLDWLVLACSRALRAKVQIPFIHRSQGASRCAEREVERGVCASLNKAVVEHNPRHYLYFRNG